MKMKLVTVTENYKNLLTMIDKRLPLSLSHVITSNLITLENEYKVIEKQRIKLVEQYAERDEEGNIKTKDNEYCFGDNKEVFHKEYNEYLGTEMELDIRTIPFSDIEKMDGNSRYEVLTPRELLKIDFMIEKS